MSVRVTHILCYFMACLSLCSGKSLKAIRKEIETVNIFAQSIYTTNTEIHMGFLTLITLNTARAIQCNRLFNNQGFLLKFSDAVFHLSFLFQSSGFKWKWFVLPWEVKFLLAWALLTGGCCWERSCVLGVSSIHRQREQQHPGECWDPGFLQALTGQILWASCSQVTESSSTFWKWGEKLLHGYWGQKLLHGCWGQKLFDGCCGQKLLHGCWGQKLLHVCYGQKILHGC